MKNSPFSEKASRLLARACIAWCAFGLTGAAQDAASAPPVPAAQPPQPAAESATPAPRGSTTPASDAPLAFPPLDHYARLWESSMFTTKALPPLESDGPKGPVFTDSLTLAGTYEVDGAFVAVLLDKTTSVVSEARIGSENEAGIKVVKVSPGATPDKARVQLQKGVEAGWVAMAELPSGSPEPVANPTLPTRPGAPGGKGGPPGINVPPVQVPPPSVRQPPPAPAIPPPVIPVPQPVPVATPAAGGGAADDLPLPPP